MTKDVAEEILDEAAGKIMAAIAHQRSIAQEAQSTLNELEKAWKAWDIEFLEDAGILAPALAEYCEKALERLEK